MMKSIPKTTPKFSLVPQHCCTKQTCQKVTPQPIIHLKFAQATINVYLASRRKPFASVLGSTERRHRIASHQCVIMFMLVCKWSQCAIECNHQANQCDICTFSFHISASHTELRTVSLLLILSRKVLFSMFVLRRFMVMCHHRHVIPSLLISPLGHTWANSFFFSFVCRHFGSIPTSYHQIQTVHLSWATFQRF